METKVGTSRRCGLWRTSASDLMDSMGCATVGDAFDIRSVVRARKSCAAWSHYREDGGPGPHRGSPVSTSAGMLLSVPFRLVTISTNDAERTERSFQTRRGDSYLYKDTYVNYHVFTITQQPIHCQRYGKNETLTQSDA